MNQLINIWSDAPPHDTYFRWFNWASSAAFSKVGSAWSCQDSQGVTESQIELWVMQETRSWNLKLLKGQCPIKMSCPFCQGNNFLRKFAGSYLKWRLGRAGRLRKYPSTVGTVAVPTLSRPPNDHGRCYTTFGPPNWMHPSWVPWNYPGMINLKRENITQYVRHTVCG